MKLIGISQRVVVREPFKERCDALDQRWVPLFNIANFIPILIPNDASSVKNLLEKIKLEGILLSGGNDLAYMKTESIAVERDEAEVILVEYAEKNNIPILGVCRGMQFLIYREGGKLVPVEGHAGQEHTILEVNNDAGIPIPKQVMSYHNYGALEKGLSENYSVLAKSEDNIIEAIKHKQLPFYGIMWHPEREKKQVDGVELLKKVYGGT